jgi:hypothetical protein
MFCVSLLFIVLLVLYIPVCILLVPVAGGMVVAHHKALHNQFGAPSSQTKLKKTKTKTEPQTKSQSRKRKRKQLEEMSPQSSFLIILVPSSLATIQTYTSDHYAAIE